MCVEVGFVLHKVTFFGSQVNIFNAVDVLFNQSPARHDQKSYVCVPSFKTPRRRFNVNQENLWQGEHFHNKEKAWEGEYPQNLWSVTTHIANARSSSWFNKTPCYANHHWASSCVSHRPLSLGLLDSKDPIPASVYEHCSHLNHEKEAFHV